MSALVRGVERSESRALSSLNDFATKLHTNTFFGTASVLSCSVRSSVTPKFYWAFESGAQYGTSIYSIDVESGSSAVVVENAHDGDADAASRLVLEIK
jgi:hypothetical protein